MINDAENALSREWLVTNGLGGFASGTVALANTRRYHGLLVASFKPPVDRLVLVSKVDVEVLYRGARYALTSNEFRDGTLAPRGFERLTDFHLDGQMPVWTFTVADALIELRIYAAHGENTAYLRVRVIAASAPVELLLTPLCAYRDYHAHMQGGWTLGVSPEPRAFTVTTFDGAHPYRVSVDRGAFESQPDWYWNFLHRVERERGLDDGEDLFKPGEFRAQLESGESLHLTATAESGERLEASVALLRDLQRTQRITRGAAPGAPAWHTRLLLAADQFIVARADSSGERAGKTVIAGYPWFSDWGRDTMIALPGLTLSTGRAGDAASILRTFGQHVSAGMLPNRFPDGGEAPRDEEYNTVDATLWYFHALDCYLEATRDTRLLAELLPVMDEILAWHQRGTRFGIGVDPEDGLLRAGVPGVQLTWMDAKVGDWVVTPRIGKPVEINALWHFAHVAMARWHETLTFGSGARYAQSAARIRESFRTRFWHGNGLFDVVDVPGGGNDATLRPNQVFAVSLGAGLLDESQARAVVELCARELLTPVGLRSLARGDAQYAPRFTGGPLQRDGAYHQGTVWSWLLGPFALAHYSVHGDAAHALGLLAGIAPHLDDACIGQVSEVFDGDAPFTPGGCCAQAWGVAETLRAWDTLQRARAHEIHTLRNTHHG
jgi:predicted glycogen debranching enzyme